MIVVFVLESPGSVEDAGCYTSRTVSIGGVDVVRISTDGEEAIQKSGETAGRR
jgi:hypothetical protein